MKGIIKITGLSFLSSLLIYSLVKSEITATLVFICVFIILFINEIMNAQRIYKSEEQERKFKKEKREFKKQIKRLERSLAYRSELDVGLIHLNGYGRVEYCNEYFYNNVYKEEVDYYLQIKDNEVYDAIFNIFNGKKVPSTIKIGENYFAIKYKVVEKERRIKSVSVQFYDVTKTEQLDKLHQSFLVDASHELNNPLSSIILASEIIERENKSEFTDILVKESHRMKTVIESIIEHSKLQVSSYEMNDFDLSALCNSYQKIYGGKKVSFVSKIEPDITMNGNMELIDRMLKNLIENAFKYTLEGSVELSLNKLENNIICRVKDTGVGISAQNTERIFDRFYRADTSRARDTGGSGIGLAIVKEVASVHDITIEVKSNEKEGSEFILTI